MLGLIPLAGMKRRCNRTSTCGKITCDQLINFNSNSKWAISGLCLRIRSFATEVGQDCQFPFEVRSVSPVLFNCAWHCKYL